VAIYIEDQELGCSDPRGDEINLQSANSTYGRHFLVNCLVFIHFLNSENNWINPKERSTAPPRVPIVSFALGKMSTVSKAAPVATATRAPRAFVMCQTQTETGIRLCKSNSKPCAPLFHSLMVPCSVALSARQSTIPRDNVGLLITRVRNFGSVGRAYSGPRQPLFVASSCLAKQPHSHSSKYSHTVK